MHCGIGRQSGFRGGARYWQKEGLHCPEEGTKCPQRLCCVPPAPVLVVTSAFLPRFFVYLGGWLCNDTFAASSGTSVRLVGKGEVFCFVIVFS